MELDNGVSHQHSWMNWNLLWFATAASLNSKESKKPLPDIYRINSSCKQILLDKYRQIERK